MPPHSHIFIGSAMPWLSRADALPQYVQSRTQG